MIQTEEWKRLPLPKNYKQQNLLNLLSHFPNVQDKVKSVFGVPKSNIIESMTLEDIKKLNSPLTSFVSGNPFKLDDYAKTQKYSTKMVPMKAPDVNSTNFLNI